MSANSKICLIWNGIDTFIPFLNISIAEIYNLGVPALASVFDLFNSCKDLIKFVPSKSSLKGATTEIVGHLRVALKLAATVRFTDGSSGFSPEELEGEELQPTGDPLKTVETRKRRKCVNIEHCCLEHRILYFFHRSWKIVFSGRELKFYLYYGQISNTACVLRGRT